MASEPNAKGRWGVAYTAAVTTTTITCALAAHNGRVCRTVLPPNTNNAQLETSFIGSFLRAYKRRAGRGAIAPRSASDTVAKPAHI